MQARKIGLEEAFSYWTHKTPSISDFRLGPGACYIFPFRIQDGVGHSTKLRAHPKGSHHQHLSWADHLKQVANMCQCQSSPTLLPQHLSVEVVRFFNDVEDPKIEMSDWLHGGSIMGFSCALSLGKMHGCLSMGDFTLLPHITKGTECLGSRGNPPLEHDGNPVSTVHA